MKSHQIASVTVRSTCTVFPTALTVLLNVCDVCCSGSGKTTLLDVIACRTEGGGLISGDVHLNSVIRTSTMVRGCSAYVRQDDRLLPHLTVKETLMFVAQLKLPTTFTTDQIKRRV